MIEVLDSAISNIEKTLIRWEQEEKIRQDNVREFNKQMALKDACIEDVNLLKKTLTSLETFYANHKTNLSSRLCNELTDIINTLFKNNYDFEFRMKYSRQSNLTTLCDSIRDGVVEDVCGGAVKQTIPFLSTISIIKQKGSQLAWLDESFSNFGVEEIEKIPDILAMIPDIQIIFTEHKLDYNMEDMNVIEISRENVNSPSSCCQITREKVKSVIEEINNKDLTAEDLLLLETFNK